jgi:hypothetical protein
MQQSAPTEGSFAAKNSNNMTASIYNEKIFTTLVK